MEEKKEMRETTARIIRLRGVVKKPAKFCWTMKERKKNIEKYREMVEKGLALFD